MTVTAYDVFAEENFVAAWREAQADEASRRAEAFLEIGRPVAGVALRLLTPQDLLILDGFRSPFVCGDPAEATPEHLVAVLWLLRAHAPSGLLGRLFGYRLHRAQLRRRWRSAAQLEQDHAALNVWFGAMFADSGAPRTRDASERPAPVGVHFLAALLMDVGCELGAIDPSTGRPLVESPLPRLFQYQKILRMKREKDRFIDFNSADRVKSEALAAWNALPAEEKAPWEKLAAEINAARAAAAPAP